jgi:acetyltransferase-like isoleucine patch superfamily enzyme
METEKDILDQNATSIGSGYPREVIWEDPLAWFSRTANKLRTLWLAWTYPFASFGKGSWAHYSCYVARSSAPYISVGKDVALARDVRLDVRATSDKDSPVLVLEEGCGLQRRGTYSARNHIHLMRNVICSHSVLVTDHARPEEDGVGAPTGRWQETEGGTIRIEEECWIGFGAVIACGQGELVIGRHSVVGANSVVTRSIPPYSVVAGDPVRIVRQYDFSKRKWVLGCVRPVVDAEPRDSEPAARARS